MTKGLPQDGKDEVRYPLSYAQERLWLEYVLDPGSSSYNLPVALHLSWRS
jgi:hypothetical protein